VTNNTGFLESSRRGATFLPAAQCLGAYSLRGKLHRVIVAVHLVAFEVERLSGRLPMHFLSAFRHGLNAATISGVRNT
jgi:hypothetical protein